MGEVENGRVLRRLLVEFREEGIPSDLKEREAEVNIREKKAHALTGIRRSGKTYRLFQIISGVGGKDSFYVNFEDERLVNPDVNDLSNLLPLIEETFETGEPIYLFVDEVQNVENWEKWARRIAEKEGVVLFLTGSSSRLSSREISTALRGRTRTTYVFPLDFREFLRFKDVTFDLENIEYSQRKPELRRYFREYLKYGGFPEIVLEEDEREKPRILREYFSTIVARDLIERFSVEKTGVLESFMKLLVNNFSRLVSFSKARNWLKSMGVKVSKNTLMKYFDYMKSSYFAFDSTIYSKSVKDRLQYPRKIYLIDNGFASALTERFDSDRGWFFENMMAVKLYKDILPDPRKELHYWKDGGREVDFVIRDGVKTESIVQVCSEINDRSRGREVENIFAASEDLDCDNLKVITDDYFKEEEIGGKEIRFVPLWIELLKPEETG